MKEKQKVRKINENICANNLRQNNSVYDINYEVPLKTTDHQRPKVVFV